MNGTSSGPTIEPIVEKGISIFNKLNFMKTRIFLAALFFISCLPIWSQGVAATTEYVKELTSDWQGERFDDGRPKVPDALLKRLKKIQMEEAWGYLRNKGYNNQYDGDWEILHPDSVMTGKVLTAQYLSLIHISEPTR